MPTVPHTGRVAHFGVFELDLRSAELRKSGVKIRLQEQPFQVLAALLEHPGAVVTREELINRLWPDGTVVDYEHSLGTAVNKIRQALGDSADNPRFVETVPRRGYRFIYPVERPAPLPVGARHAVPAGTWFPPSRGLRTKEVLRCRKLEMKESRMAGRARRQRRRVAQ